MNSHNYHIGSFSHHTLSPCISAWTITTHSFIHIIKTDLSTCRPVDQLLLTRHLHRMRSCFRYMMIIDSHIYHIASFFHHALSPCISAWTIPTHPFIYFINVDLSTCRPVDFSTCRPSAIDDNKDPVDQHLHLHLYTLLILICRFVALKTCRPVDLLV